MSFLDTQNKTTLALTGGGQTIRSVTINDGVTGTITGGGTLILNGPADFGVGGETAGAAQGLNLSGLSAFIFSAPTNGFLVGGQSSGISGSGTVFLAATSSITAGAVGVQSVVGSTTAQSSGNLYLGRNTTINADILNVGLTRDNGLIQFAASTTNPLLVLRAADGVSRANVTIGSRGSSYFSTTSGSVDLMTNVSASSRLDALLGTLQIANEGYCTTASDLLNGNLVMGNGTLDATAISIGLKSSSTSQSLGIVNGTFTQNNGAVKVAQLTLGDKTTGNTGTLNATYNLNGGVLSAQTIQPGANAATRTLNWNNGSLANYDASTDLTIAAGLTLALNPAGTNIFNISNGRTGTVNSVLSGGGGVFENGGGTLVLTATNTYSGPTSLGAGTLMVAGALGTNSGIILPGTMAGSGTLTIGTLNLGDSASATTYSRFTLANGGKIAATTLNVQGTHIIQILDSTLAIGTNTLFSYTGAPGGNGFTGFKLGTVPAGIATSLRNSGASVQLVVAPLIAPGLTGTPALDSNGFRFSFSGSSGQNYQVLVSTNLGSPITNWQVLSGGNFGAGTINFTDSAPMSAQKFYRITSP